VFILLLFVILSNRYVFLVIVFLLLRVDRHPLPRHPFDIIYNSCIRTCTHAVFQDVIVIVICDM